MMDHLLTERLVSCCQKISMTSSYHWKGKIETNLEYLVQMKTRKELYLEVEKEILKNHSYETPQIICYDISNGSQDYLSWI